MKSTNSNMKKHISIFALLMIVATAASAQPVATGGDIFKGIPLRSDSIASSFVVNVNTMDQAKQKKLNTVASQYQATRGAVLTSIGTGLAMSFAEIVGKEAINLVKIRSRQKKEWLQMRQSECLFVDSLQSVRGQCDFYNRPSVAGPLDPTGMVFDGITISAYKNGKEVLQMVCHIDSSRFDQLFVHSRFYLVLDSLVFYPYRSYLPNMHVSGSELARQKKMPREVVDYWRTISQFDFAEQQSPQISVSFDLYSSWINELVQVFQDVKLGSFMVNVPVTEASLRDSVYIYSRRQALAAGQPVIEVEGSSFVVPRSYMPVAANRPSWGTGEYKLKVVISESCRYNPKGDRAKHWHRDYKQLVRMASGGKAKNEYLSYAVTTLRDNGGVLLKAVYSPVLNNVLGTDVKGTASGHSGK